ncbi:PolC-type DNA polymerase III [Aerococcaceae bacterium DSM 111176]|nr:PolC-type DNA polymerase III [Aerococcaceae bacterium DSM 111176]
MTDKRHLFEVLLQQLAFNNDSVVEALADVTIKEVNVVVGQQQWEFYFTNPTRLHPEVYQVFQLRMFDAFSDIADIQIWWEFEDDQMDDEQIQAYWFAVYSALANEKPFIRSVMQHANYQYESGILTISLSSEQVKETIETKYHELFMMRLKQAGIENLQIQYQIDEDLRNQEMDAHINRQKEEDEKSLMEAMEALEAQERRQQAPVIEEDSDVKPIGKDIPNGTLILPMSELTESQFRIVTEGYVFAKEVKDLRNGGQLSIMHVTDYSGSVQVKIMTGRGIKANQLALYNKGDWIRLEGDLIPDNYSSELYIRPRSVRKIKAKFIREDNAPEGQKRIELHAHSQMSPMDATNSAEQIVEQAAKWGHPAVAITDHGGVQAFPKAYHAGKKHDIKVLFGMEAYVVNDGEPVAYNPQHIPLKDATYVVFDVETTGLSSVYDKMIELAAVKMRGGEVIDTFETFINPNQKISAFTTELTSITNAQVEAAPQEAPVMEDFYKFSEGSILVAHNASFDIGFINKAYERIGKEPTSLPVIDTLELSRTVNPDLKSHRLNTLAKRYGVSLDQHHRAVYDSEATGYLMLKLLDQAREQFDMTYHDQLNDQLGQGNAYQQARPYHTTLLVKNQKGLKDLFKLVSESNTKYYYRGVPRVPLSLLNQYKDDLLLGTACSQGEVFTAMMQKGYDEALKLVADYDYIELMPKSYYFPLVQNDTISSESDLEDIMRKMVQLGKDSGKLVVASGNVHYIDQKDGIYTEVLQRSMKQNQNRTLYFSDAHFRTTEEMLREYAFLGEDVARELVLDNPQKIADMIEEVEVIKSDLYSPTIEGAEDDIRQMSYDKAHEMYGPDLPEIVTARLEKELKSIIGNGFAVIYLISQKLVHKSNEDGYLVGSRGSVGSSLVATMTGITEVNPLAPHYYCTNCYFNEFFTQGEIGSGFDLEDKACPHCGEPLKKDGQDIPFETFLGFYGDKVPDIDLNFSGEYQSRAHAYTKVLFGDDYVFRAGTITTVATKTALGYVRGYGDATGEMIPQAERLRLAEGIEGVKRSTGQHPGGIIVIPEYMDVFDFTPIQYPADDMNAEWRTTHFDFHSIDENVLKLDILGHDDPTMVKMLQDLSGIDQDSIPFDDEDVMKIFSGTEVLGVTPEQIFSETGTLGVPEFGTGFVRGMLAETKPTTFAELLQISGLSHGTDVWLGNAQELIRNKVVPLSEVIGCRDDIMVALIQYGLEDGLAFKIMEHVRKGRGIPDEWQEEMRAHNVPEWYIDSCLKIKYMFPKAHAAAYIMMALRVAYFKVHHPIIYYATYFSVRAKDFDLVAMAQGKEVVKSRIQEINGKGFDATNTEKTLVVELEVANEMLERGFKFQMIDLNKSDAHHFIIEGDTLIPPFRAIPGLGGSVADQIIKARAEAPFLSKEDLQKRGKVSKTIIAYMTEHGVLEGMPDEDQLSLF